MFLYNNRICSALTTNLYGKETLIFRISARKLRGIWYNVDTEGHVSTSDSMCAEAHKIMV